MIGRLMIIPVAALLGIIFTQVPAAARAAEGNTCNKDVFLTITGPMGTALNHRDHVYEMTEEEFRALPVSRVTTETPWTPRSEFVGPLLSSVLEKVGAQGKALRFFALNEFSMKVERRHAVEYGMILATSRDGQTLTRRDWGPIFAIYPVDSYPELDTPVNISSQVWQICGIAVE